MRTAIVGCGSLGLRVMKMLNVWQEVQLYDDDPARPGLFGRPVLGTVEDLLGGEPCAVYIAIGDPSTRRRLYMRFKEAGFWMPCVVHETATLELGVKIYSGVIVKVHASIGPWTTIGENTIIGGKNMIGHDSIVGNHCNLGPGVVTGGHVSIGDNCILGIGVSVDRGLSVGSGSIIGSGCTLWKSVPPNSFVKLPNSMIVQERV